ncbi:TadE/TadG family type IV pilus assembly protein [Streptomyces sp. ODS28]|uniref:TadE/TadG family type IV pilus assembly protein n=1 Tax=Streptomyces sp. ODS28 TaxID=3136688 RepID=UPI0031F0BEB1
MNPVRRRLRGLRGDAGLSTVEVVILAPVMMLFILVLVALGQLVDGRGAVDGAARDAARAGSMAHGDIGQAMAAAQRSARASIGDTCVNGVSVRDAGSSYRAGGIFTVEVTCEVRGLGMLGLDIGKDITGRSSAPIDPLKRTQ